MYWTFTYKGISYASWGEPRLLDKKDVTDLKPRFDVKVYNGENILKNDNACFFAQGDSSLGMGDSIWLINYMRDVYAIKARRRCNFTLVSSPWVLNFYKNFLPSSFNYQEEYMTEKQFNEQNHKLPGMYYWHDTSDDADRSWLDNKSLIERLYGWSGIEYTGLADWGDFTNPKILYPEDSFYEKLNINKNDKYVYFQWHSSGHSKNISPKTNIKLIKHIIKKYGLKVYVVGRLKSLDIIENIPGVVNLSGKTEGMADALFTLVFNSEFCVCPDSAGIHLAEAYKVPCVGIMSTLPPVYIASKYKIPTFMFGEGKCPYRPCGIVHQLPRKKCPPDTGEYCRIFNDIDLDLFDKCVLKSFQNRQDWKNKRPLNFYEALKEPISLVY